MTHFIHRLKNGEVDIILAILQLGAFVVTFFLVVISALIYRHMTDDALMPTWGYLASIKITAPPIVVLTATYFYAFITGESVTEAPKRFWHWLRNVALQNKRIIIFYLTAAIVFSVLSAIFLHLHTPPSYKNLVDKMMGGENDDHQVILESITQLKEKNPKLSERLNIIRQVFDERRVWNNGNKHINPTIPRIYIRSLEADINDSEWAKYPLRIHALAEAYSMLAQALPTDNMGLDAKNRALKYYDLIINSKSNLTTDLMRYSASLNKGNVYFYSGDNDSAIKQYKSIVEDYNQSGLISSSMQANLVAAYVSKGVVDREVLKEGISVGKAALDDTRIKSNLFTEMRGYVSLTTNIGFAELISGDSATSAIDHMKAAYDLIPDAMAIQNFALALDAAGKIDKAFDLLSQDSNAPMVSLDSESDVVYKYGGHSCTYFIRAVVLLHSGNASDRGNIAANFSAYLGAAQPKDLLLRNFDSLKNDAYTHLKLSPEPCNALQHLPSVKSWF